MRGSPIDDEDGVGGDPSALHECDPANDRGVGWGYYLHCTFDINTCMGLELDSVFSQQVWICCECVKTNEKQSRWPAAGVMAVVVVFAVTAFAVARTACHQENYAKTLLQVNSLWPAHVTLLDWLTMTTAIAIAGYSSPSLTDLPLPLPTPSQGISAFSLSQWGDVALPSLILLYPLLFEWRKEKRSDA